MSLSSFVDGFETIAIAIVCVVVNNVVVCVVVNNVVVQW